MTFEQSIRTCLSKYADFNGRASRPEYWWFFLATGIAVLIFDVLFRTTGNAAFVIVEFAIALALLLPSLAAGARRLHDTDRSGWWLLIDLIPIVGFIILVVLLAQRGTVGANRFGEEPAAVAA